MLINPVNKTGVNICAVFFDLDGTIIDSKPGIIASMKEALLENGIADFDGEKFANTIGRPLKGMIQETLPELNDETIEKIIKSYRKYYAQSGGFNCTPYQGIDETLRRLSADFDLYVVTLKLEEMAEKALSALHLDGYFAGIKGTPADKAVETKARLIETLLAETQLNADNVIMIGDRREDILSAKENGIKTIAVSYGYGTPDEYGEVLFTAPSAAALLDYIW
jgi:phosphoglycolate phosphatase